jgi:hypothetical protein
MLFDDRATGSSIAVVQPEKDVATIVQAPGPVKGIMLSVTVAMVGKGEGNRLQRVRPDVWLCRVAAGLRILLD